MTPLSAAQQRPAGISPIGVEALDDPSTDARLVQRMLRDIARCNRWLGGFAAVRAGLAGLIGEADRGRSLSLLDVGTGAGDIPLLAARWASRRQVSLQPVGVERLRPAAMLAARSGVATLMSCATALPFPDHAIDIVVMSQLLHHFDDDCAIAVLREADRVARRGVIVADLDDSVLSRAGFVLVSPLLGLHRSTVIDGVTSLRRGRDATQLARLCGAANVSPVIRRLPFARITMWWRTS